MKRILGSRRDRYLAKFSIFLITVALIAGMVGCDGYTPSQNLEIWTWYDLSAVRNNLAGDHTLMNDLNSTTAGYTELASPTANGGKGWEPIGFFYDAPFYYAPFIGSLDGQGYEIRDLFINRPDEDRVGLFGIVDEEGAIKDIGLVNASVLGQDDAGGLAGFNSGTVSDSYSTGSVTGDEYVGGLLGINLGTVNDSYSNASVTGSREVGGLVGENSGGTVSYSYSTGSVTGNSDVGGLVGDNYYGTLSNSYSTGTVTGDYHVGGLVGFSYEGTVSNSYYNYDEVLINGENIITTGALFGEDFEQWLANDKFLDFNERLSQENGYYVINNVTDFKELLAFGENATLKFRLKSDLDLGDEPNFYIPCLAGEFNGNGHKISNLSFSFDFVANVGLFGYLSPGGKVTQVGVENVKITGASFVGGLVGYNRGGSTSNSYSTGNITGRVSVTGYKEGFGGLVGYNVKGTVSDCYATCSVSGNSHVGGLVGYSSGTVSNSYSTGTITGTWGTTGGLVGYSSGTVSNSYSTGSVTGTRSVGGLVGYNYGGSTSNSYSTGSVTGNDDVGGLVGVNWDGTVTDSFWDIETSGQSTSAGGTGKTTTEMKNTATFSGTGWNITAVANPGTRNSSYIWNTVDEQTYPFLSWQS